MSNYTYMVTNKLNGKVYVGSHSWDGEGLDPNYYGSGTAITRAVKKYGKENFQVEVLYYYDTIEECRADEERILTEYDVKNCPHSYNCKNSAIGFTSEDVKGKNNPMYGRTGEKHPFYGKTRTEETRNKISQAIKGKTHTEDTRNKISQANKGRTRTEETRNKISQALRGEKHPFYGRTHTADSKKKMSQAKKGIPRTEEHRNKISQALKGKTHSESTRNKMSQAHGGKPFVAIKDGKVKIFTSQAECGRVLGLYHSSINQCLKGKLKTTGGYTFKYVEQLDSGIYEGML